MFISGIVVSAGPPPVSWIEGYFDDFKANAVHLWADGLPTEMNAWRAARPGARWVSWVNKHGMSADKNHNTVIGGYPANEPGRIGYQIGDEPWTMAALQEMEKGVDSVRKADPNALIYVNFNDKASTQMLDYYGQMDCDVISYDRYSRSISSYKERGLIRQYGLKYKIPYWRYIKSYYTANDSAETSESDMRWDAFSGLVYGYTGHTWFVYQIGPGHDPKTLLFDTGSFSSAKASRYSVAAQINVEMRNLGRCITQLTSTDVRYIPSIPLLQPPQTQTWAAGAGGDPFITSIAPAPGQLLLDISVGFFKDDAGEQYVMVQNARHHHGSWPTSSKDPGTIRITFDFAGSNVDSTKVLSLRKETGTVDNLALVSEGSAKARLDVTLAAGDPVFFKYATGKSFTLGP